MILELHQFLTENGFKTVDPSKRNKLELYTTIRNKKVCIIRCYFFESGLYVYNFKSMGIYGLNNC